MYEKEEENEELASKNETSEKESKKGKETHIVAVENLRRHHGPSEPLETAHPLPHDVVDDVGLPLLAEPLDARPGEGEEEADDPEKEKVKEKKEESKSEEGKDVRQREEDAYDEEHDISLKEEKMSERRPKEEEDTHTQQQALKLGETATDTIALKEEVNKDEDEEIIADKHLDRGEGLVDLRQVLPHLGELEDPGVRVLLEGEQVVLVGHAEEEEVKKIQTEDKTIQAHLNPGPRRTGR